MSREIIFTIAYGQSNAEGGGLRRLRRAQRIATHGIIDGQRALMFNTGMLGTEQASFQPDAITSFVPAVEDPRRGESGGVSYMRYSLAYDLAKGDRDATYLYRTTGQSGESIRSLANRKGVAFGNFMKTVRRAWTVASQSGMKLSIPHYLWDQGEADRKARMPGDAYFNELLTMHSRLSKHIHRRTRQERPLWMLMTILTAPSSRFGLKTGPDISLAQVQACNGRLTIAPVCSPYWFCGPFGYNPEQGVHWTPLGKAFLREFGARAARIVREAMECNPAARLGDPIRRRVYDGAAKRWVERTVLFETAPRTDLRSISRDGRTIVGEVFYAEGGLSIDPQDRPSAVDHGFEWSGEGGIEHVETENSGGRSRWRVVLDHPSSGTLSYAVTRQPIEDLTGAAMWGDVFDNCQEPSLAISGKTLRQGMLPFRVYVP